LRIPIQAIDLADTKEATDTIIDIMTFALAGEDRIEIRGFPFDAKWCIERLAGAVKVLTESCSPESVSDCHKDNPASRYIPAGVLRTRRVSLPRESATGAVPLVSARLKSLVGIDGSVPSRHPACGNSGRCGSGNSG